MTLLLSVFIALVLWFVFTEKKENMKTMSIKNKRRLPYVRLPYMGGGRGRDKGKGNGLIKPFPNKK